MFFFFCFCDIVFLRCLLCFVYCSLWSNCVFVVYFNCLFIYLADFCLFVLFDFNLFVGLCFLLCVWFILFNFYSLIVYYCIS
nr:MURF4 protein - Herpetomonas muscarum [Herpetomonas muscarum]